MAPYIYDHPIDECSVNKDDYLILREIVLREDYGHIRIRCNKEGRVYSLHLGYVCGSLPASIKDLPYLTSLSIEGELHPQDIALIFGMEHLRKLNFDSSINMNHLPIEAGGLSCLESLELYSSYLQCLPSSIGQLQNLKRLYLQHMDGLSTLPEEIGNLTSLQQLFITYSTIESLPASVGNLLNLTVAFFAKTEFKKFPEEFWNLPNLTYLGMHRSGFEILPSSVSKLRSLMYLSLSNDTMPCLGIILNLSQELKSLGHFGYLNEPIHKKVDFALACNRARLRTEGLITIKDDAPERLKILPHLLCATRRIFETYPGICFGNCINTIDETGTYEVEKPDAVYQLLQDGRELFLRIILWRNHKAAPRESEKAIAPPASLGTSGDGIRKRKFPRKAKNV